MVKIAFLQTLNGFQKINATLDNWLTKPSYRASGHMGLARIVYGVFMLWFMSSLYLWDYVGLPAAWNPPLIFSWLPRPFDFIIIAFEHMYIAVILLFLIGYKTRIATVAMFVCGLMYVVLYGSFIHYDAVSTVTFLYVPLCGLFANWGSSYSLDSVLAFKQDKSVVGPNSHDWRYILPAKLMLIILSLLFFSSGLSKITNGGAWLTDMDVLSCLFPFKNLNSYITNGSEMNIVPHALGTAPFVPQLLQVLTLLFELTFPFALLNGRFTAVYLRLAIAFHVFNSFLLGIPFIAVLPAYILFINWQLVYERIVRLEKYRDFLGVRLRAIPTKKLIFVTQVFILLISLTWNTDFIRSVFSLGNNLDGNRASWIALLPFIILWVIQLKRGKGVLEWSNPMGQKKA